MEQERQGRALLKLIGLTNSKEHRLAKVAYTCGTSTLWYELRRLRYGWSKQALRFVRRH